MKQHLQHWLLASTFSALLPLDLAAQASSIPAHATLTTFYRTVEVDGLNIFYREAGPKDAPVILLLHGFPTSSRMFRNLIPALADRYRLIAPDYPGFGHSATPPAEICGFFHLRDVGSFLNGVQRMSGSSSLPLSKVLRWSLAKSGFEDGDK